MHWPELTAAVEELRSARNRTLDIASGLSQDLAAKRVRPGTWSVVEVLDHILRTEVAYRKYEIQALDRAGTGATGTIRIGFREVDTRLRPFPAGWMPILAPVLYGLHAVIPFRVRLAVMRKPGILWAAAPKVAEPRRDRLLEELRVDLATEMRTTAALFEGDLPETLPRVRGSLDPLYGSNSMVQMVQLMAAHGERHQHQLRRILKQLHAPA